ncbi:MAG: DNA-3-methyladenine glycosylase [Desulfobacterales bacterium]|jgi:DNA-3-methyladenine glycosylase
MSILNRRFYARETLAVAGALLGKKLVRKYSGNILSGLICEIEAYLGSTDSASHAFKGKTPRNTVMFGRAGRAYVYFVYGMHYLLNVVTEEEENPCAILIRAIVPLDGIEYMQLNRGRSGKDLSDGPAKLCQALAIDKSLNGWDLTAGKKLWMEDRPSIPGRFIKRGPRIGIDYARPADRRAARRFWIDEKYINDMIKAI